MSAAISSAAKGQVASPVEPCALEMKIGWLLSESGAGSGYRPINGIRSEVLALSRWQWLRALSGGFELNWSISAIAAKFS